MPLTYTAIEDIPKIVKSLHKSYRENPYPEIQYRLNQLRSLYFAILDNEDLIIEAVQKDLNKPREEILMIDMSPIYSELLLTIRKLSTWAKPKSAKDVPFLFKFSAPQVQYIPLGCILVISPFNYPVNLAVQPLIGAIAAGNVMVLKQSELTPNTSEVLGNILTDALDPKIFQVVDGAVDETTALLDQKFDKIMYTGSGQVGKLIAEKAGKTLTPVLLELGGKSPAFVTPSVNDKLYTVCKRIALTKFTNSGQICVSTDYCVVHDSIYDEFVETMQKVVKKYYSLTPETATRIIHERAYDRIVNIIQDTKGDIVLGGHGDRSKLFIEPTIVENVSFSDSTMQQEIFGPILPIIKYSDLNTTIDSVLEVGDTPLALYVYSTNRSEQDLISQRIRSGALVINEGMIHAGLSSIPFGGVGESGYGSYHGETSFKAFSHERAVMKQPFWVEPLFEAKYPPITNFDLKMSKFFMTASPTFGRTGYVRSHNYEFLTAVVIAAGVGVIIGYFATK